MEKKNTKIKRKTSHPTLTLPLPGRVPPTTTPCPPPLSPLPPILAPPKNPPSCRPLLSLEVSNFFLICFFMKLLYFCPWILNFYQMQVHISYIKALWHEEKQIQPKELKNLCASCVNIKERN